MSKRIIYSLIIVVVIGIAGFIVYDKPTPTGMGTPVGEEICYEFGCYEMEELDALYKEVVRRINEGTAVTSELEVLKAIDPELYEIIK